MWNNETGFNHDMSQLTYFLGILYVKAPKKEKKRKKVQVENENAGSRGGVIHLYK